jgi:isoquinoline 1-oxidoreductase beta subunit
MHPLMNQFHADQQRRFMELLAVDETALPMVSRRVFLQSAGATGLAIGFGWLSPTSANAALPGAEGAATGPLAPNAFIPRRD